MAALSSCFMRLPDFARNRLVWMIGGGILILGLVAVVVGSVVAGGGASSANLAMLDKISSSAASRTPRILVNHGWGEGRILLAAYRRSNKDLTLAVGFVRESGGGWKVENYTEEKVTSNDVKVGSLVVVSSEGAEGQPPWSVAAGHLVEPRIGLIEIRWASGDVSRATRKNNAYLVIQAGTTTPLEARYLANDGTEIARVPLEGT